MGPQLALATLLATAVSAPARTAPPPRKIYGTVVMYPEGSPKNVRLRLGDHGFADVKDDGQFEIVPAPGETSVEISLVQPAELAIIAPPDRRISVANDASAPIWVVVGVDIRRYLLERLAARQADYRSWTSRLGTSMKGQTQEIRADTRAILAKLEVSERDFQTEVSRHQDQAKLVPEILNVTDAYLLKLGDLREVLEHIAPLAAQDPHALSTVVQAMREYNVVFTPFNNGRNAFESRISTSWRDVKAEGLTRDLGDLYRLAIEEIHKPHVLSLNEDLVTLQRIGQHAAPSRAEVDAAGRRIAAHAREITTKLDSLRVCFDRLRAHLQAP